MPSLYTHAESNVRKTWVLMFFFLVFIILLGWLFSYLLDNPIFLIIAVALAIFQSFSSYWYSDKIILSLTRAKLIEKKDNPEWPILRFDFPLRFILVTLSNFPFKENLQVSVQQRPQTYESNPLLWISRGWIH